MNNFEIIKMEISMINECVDLFIDVFSKEPWNDVYESRNQVINFFENHMNNNYFCGYVGVLNEKIVALSIGMKKPWIKGMEYYIDEFCVHHNLQGKGIGSYFLKQIESNVKELGMNGIILNTERNVPAKEFYINNGFDVLEDLIVLGRDIRI